MSGLIRKRGFLVLRSLLLLTVLFAVGAFLATAFRPAKASLTPRSLMTAGKAEPMFFGAGIFYVTGSPNNSCFEFEPASGNGPDDWEIIEGGRYNVLLAGVTECIGDWITLYIQSTSVGNFCYNLQRVPGTNDFTGTITMPAQGCFTMPISYKCGADQPCNNTNTYNAQGSSPSPDGVHFRFNTWGPNCSTHTEDTDCTGGGGGNGCLITAPPGGNLGCNPAETAYACNPAGATTTPSGTCGTINVTCAAGTPTNVGCNWTVTNTYTGTCATSGLTCTDTQTFTWKVDTTDPVLPTLPTGGDLGCNPTTLPSCNNDLVATDNCDGNITVVCSAGSITGDCNKSQTFTYTATDSCGNDASGTVTYTWKVDTQDPVLPTLPTGGDLGCNPTTLPSCNNDLVATDNCGNVPVVCSAGPITGDCNKSQTFTYTATDSCGNDASGTVTYTWKVDNTGPVLPTLPTGGNLGCNPTTLPTCQTGLMANDACDGQIPVTCTPGDISVNGCLRTQVFTYSATDGCENTTSDTVTYNWKVDNTGPVLPTLPTGGNLGCNPTTLPTCQTGLMANDACDGQIPVTCTPGDISVNGCLRTQTFTYSATDGCGNTTSDTVTYNWKVDTEPPAFDNCPEHRELKCFSDLPPVPPVYATDNCGAEITAEYLGQTTSNGSSNCNNTVTRRWRAEDECHNVAYCTQTITVDDDVRPQLPPDLPEGGYLGCNPTLPTCVTDLYGTDNCDHSIPVHCSPQSIGESGCMRTQVFTYTVTDSCGNHARHDVTYSWKEDHTDPTFDNCPTNESYQCYADVPEPPEVTASDNCGGIVHVSGPVVTESAPGSSCNNTITRVWTATDACGNHATCTQTITVNDTTDPVLPTLPTGGELGCNPPAPACDNSLMATDNCDGQIPVVCTAGDITGDPCARTQVFTYTATDTCGNDVSDTVTYTWKEDNTDPELHGLPSPSDVETCNPTRPVCGDFNVTATDNCDTTAPTVTCTAGDVLADPEVECGFQQKFTWSATDLCGNEASESVTFKWKESHVTIACPPDLTVNAGEGGCYATITQRATVTGCGVTADDVVYTIDGTEVDLGTYQFPVGTTTVNATVTGPCDSANCEFDVSVLGKVCLYKFWDGNLDTIDNDGADGTPYPLKDFPFVIKNGTTVVGTYYTEADGTVCVDLPAGTYTVEEGAPSNWVPTTTDYAGPFTIDATTCSFSYKFGNVCLGQGGGRTPGSWSNKNGLGLLDQTDFAFLTSLNLVKRDGVPQDFTGTLTANKTAFKAWLLGGDAYNMAYMLSVHLACMELSVRKGFVDPNAMLYSPGDCTGADDFISVQDNMDLANASILAHPRTIDTELPGSAYRPYQDCLKYGLWQGNLNLNFVQHDPCPLSPPLLAANDSLLRDWMLSHAPKFSNWIFGTN